MLRILILLSFFLIAASPAWCAEVIRVAFYPLKGFFEYDEHGKPEGYGVEYLTKIAEYTGFSFQFVQTDAWEKTGPMLDNGQVDLCMPVELSRNTGFLSSITADPILQTFYAVFTLNSRNDLYYNDFEQFAHIRLGISERILKNQDILEQLQALNLNRNLVPFTEYNECRKALEDGRIDGIISNVLDMTEDTKMLARFKVVPTHIMMRKTDPRIAPISNAVTTIKLNEQDFETTLYKKYFLERNAAPYTKKEKEFIQKHPVLTVAVYQDRKPMSFMDPKSGHMEGIAIDMMRLLEKKTGLSFSFIPIPPYTPALSMFESHKVDLVMPAPQQRYLREQGNIIVTNPLLTIPLAFVGLKGRTVIDGQPVRIVALHDNSGFIQKAFTSFPNASLQSMPTIKSCLDAVEDNKADVFFHTLYPIDYALQYPQYTNLGTILPFTSSSAYALAGKNTDSPEMFSILKKGLERITQEERESTIRNSQAVNRYIPNLADRIYANAWPLGTFTVLGCMLLVWNASRIRSLQRLERANKAISIFLSRMSHDIRTPMNAILGLVKMTIEMPRLPKEAKKNLEDAVHSGEYLLGLINDVLDMSKIENGKTVITLAPVRYESFCSSIMKPLQTLARNKDVTLTWGQSFRISRPIMLDRQHCSQILVNIVSNAIKFTPGGGRIHIQSDKICASETAMTCRIIVSDTGIGISPDFLPHICEPFQQEDASRTGELNGTGLGLSIVRHLMDLMGGTLEVASEQEKGTTFTLTLTFPFATDEQIAAMQTKPSAPENTHTPNRVLLAEDHPMNVLVAKKILEKRGIAVEHAANGQAAIDAFSANPEGYYDAILMDIRMPIMDGLEAARTIRALDRPDAGNIPIIAMTANASEADRKNCADSGMTAFLTKPIVPQELYSTLSPKG